MYILLRQGYFILLYISNPIFGASDQNCNYIIRNLYIFGLRPFRRTLHFLSDNNDELFGKDILYYYIFQTLFLEAQTKIVIII